MGTDKQNTLSLCPCLFCSPQNLPEQRHSSLLGLRPSVTVQPLHTLSGYGTEQGGLLEKSHAGNRSLCLFLSGLNESVEKAETQLYPFPVLVQLITGIGGELCDSDDK